MHLSAVSRVFVACHLNAGLTFTFLFLFLDSHGISGITKVKKGLLSCPGAKEKKIKRIRFKRTLRTCLKVSLLKGQHTSEMSPCTFARRSSVCH